MVANQLKNLLRLRHPARLLLRENLLSVGVYVQRAGRPNSNAGGYLQLTVYLFFQAHGLCLNVMSEETTADLYSHVCDSSTLRGPSGCATVGSEYRWDPEHASCRQTFAVVS